MEGRCPWLHHKLCPSCLCVCVSVRVSFTLCVPSSCAPHALPGERCRCGLSGQTRGASLSPVLLPSTASARPVPGPRRLSPHAPGLLPGLAAPQPGQCSTGDPSPARGRGGPWAGAVPSRAAVGSTELHTQATYQLMEEGAFKIVDEEAMEKSGAGPAPHLPALRFHHARQSQAALR
ncbi:bifunctional peptidase and (3S)-lysyl hydroxylase JMJD7 [Dipodomys merriami]|uniref:bifunctional peptidase and (3S)-lysyl hydroxylase JMJD7 n=1 Tax=Dipodomys merriami TaxID=94247 RepID=UPI003855A933